MHVFPNNKKYIGITCKNPNARWENGGGYSKTHQPVMYNAIQKYGWENIKHYILFEDLSLEEAKMKEQELIEEYHTYCHLSDSQGYNMTRGGEGTSGHICSEDAKKRMSLAKIGKCKGDDCYKSKAVICEGIRYPSITEFCKVYNLGRGMVEKWLNRKANMPQKWIDKELHLEDDTKPYLPQKIAFQYKIIYDNMEFESQKEFANYLNIAPSLLCRWIKNDKIPQEILNKGFKRIENSA